jgi:hypothetical protein
VALSDEQNAMLRLLASGEQGYGDIAALLGLSEDEVRAKVVGALAQLQAEGKPAPDIPPPIAGGAKPAAEVTPPEPEPPAPAEPSEPAAEPVVADAVAPGQAAADPVAPKAAAEPQARKPVAPTPSKAAPAAPPASRPPSGGRTVTLPSGRGAWYLGGGILAAIVVIVVVVLLVSGGSSDDSSSSSTTANEGATNTAAENGAGESIGEAKEATQAELTAVDGSAAAGLATFGRLKNKLALQIEAKGLEPTVEGTDAYTIWLAQSPQKMLPLASTAVKGSGKGAEQIAAQFEVPVEILAYLAKGTFDQIAVTRTQTKPFEASIEAATKNKTTPKYTGEPVLRGTITGPIIGLAQREEEEQKSE